MKNLIKNLIFLLKNRFIFFGIFLFVFVCFQYYFSGAFLPSTETKDIWFYSGIFMVLFSILFIEPYYSSPKNVITNAIPLLLVLLAIRTSFNNVVFWWAAICILISLICFSILAIALDDKDNSSDHWKNRISTSLKDAVVLVGQGKILYSSVFIYFLLTYHSIQNSYTLILFILWFFTLVIDPKEIHGNFKISNKKKTVDQIGEIFGVQSKKIFLIKLFDDKRQISKFDLVKFRYSMQDVDGFIIRGIIFDTYLLNQEKWAKILQLSEPIKEETKLEKNIVYRISDHDEVESVSKELKIDNLVGVIVENSTIGKIKFEYSKKIDDIQEGDLLELNIDGRRLFYQVVSGSTEIEKLEKQNETGFIEGEAIQLGEWKNDKLSFQKFGWVPPINTPLFKADTSDIEIENFDYPLYKLGTIPETTLPCVIDLSQAVSHHLALIGVTGSGKSFIAREIISKLLSDTKIICIDFTGEWKDNLKNLSPTDLIDSTKLGEVEELIAKKETEASGKNPDKSKLLKYKKGIHEKLLHYVTLFIKSNEGNLALFELPELSNTMFILEFTQMFLDAVFSFAKNNIGQKVCIILEEAHTIIPETNFLGDLGDYGSSKALVSKMSQLALQGRKYGIGLLVIAQRTANVSKTVLTQCNTVICFQAFDETSFTFLGNYVGKDMIQALPNLKQYHAIVAGKAVKSNVPMIIDLTRS